MSGHGAENDAATYCGAEYGEVREGECECPRHRAENVVTVEYAHRWFEYGRWFYGFGSSMDPHICGEAGAVCEWRERTITVSPWSDWSRAAPTPCEDCEQGVVCDKHRPIPPGEGDQ